ncbi:MAG: antitoxin Xre/MbcA/ParS toxin-binding domain-containing protein [Sphingomonas sp.]
MERPAIAATGASATPDTRRRTRSFRPARVAMPPLAAARQARIAALAWAALGDRERVMAFLNSEDARLGGRPLDLAIASDAGLARVEVVLSGIARS